MAGDAVGLGRGYVDLNDDGQRRAGAAAGAGMQGRGTRRLTKTDAAKEWASPMSMNEDTCAPPRKEY
jgi:hypothetical protein